MSRGDAPIPAPSGLALGRVLRDLLSDDQALTTTGVGANLTMAIVDLARAADRLATAIERFTDQQT